MIENQGENWYKMTDFGAKLTHQLSLELNVIDTNHFVW